MSVKSFLSFRPLLLIILLSIIIRLLVLFCYIDLSTVKLYEYGEIASNLHKGLGYSIHYFNEKNVYPSAYMPPGYVYIVYLFTFFNETTAKMLILIFQILISSLTIIALYRLTVNLFSKRIAIISILIYAILPEFIYANLSITPTSLFHLFILLIFIYAQHVDHFFKQKDCFSLGILFGISILFRSEMVLLLFLYAFYFLFKKKFQPAIWILIISLLFILPWTVRNFITFESFIPFTTSLGQNLYRGHNPYEIGVWNDDEIINRIEKFKGDYKLELEMNRLFKEQAIDFIIANPAKELVYTVRKIFHLWIFNPLEKGSKHLLYLIPWLMILAFSLTSFLRKYNLKNQKFILIFLIYFSLISIMFFVLPRYQTMMKIALLSSAAAGIEFLLVKTGVLKNEIENKNALPG